MREQPPAIQPRHALTSQSSTHRSRQRGHQDTYVCVAGAWVYKGKSLSTEEEMVR
jgi:hypothetical protein